MSARAVIVAVGLALVALGLVVGLVPATTVRDGTTIHCGSPFRPAYASGHPNRSYCDSANHLSDRRAFGLAFVAAGGVLLISAVVARPRRPRDEVEVPPILG
jgi:uncharacterized protein YjeT (DUF2065 family)